MKYIGHICLATCMFCALICSCHSIPDWKRSKLNLDPCPEACRIMLKVVEENSTIDYDYLWYVLCVLQLIRTHTRAHTCAHTQTHTHTQLELKCMYLIQNLNACIRYTNIEARTSIHVECV